MNTCEKSNQLISVTTIRLWITPLVAKRLSGAGMMLVSMVSDVITAAWCEQLRRATKLASEFRLDDNMLPPESILHRKTWNACIAQTGLTHEEVESILREFGSSINEMVLPSGAVIRRDNDSFFVTST